MDVCNIQYISDCVSYCKDGDSIMEELKSCPFCGGTDIRHSLKISGKRDIYYHSVMYCNKCHTYGPRVMSEKFDHNNYKGRYAIEKDESLKIKAIEAWNRRVK